MDTTDSERELMKKDSDNGRGMAGDAVRKL